jgi:sortase (surface protein transpeptidase)
LKPGDMYQIEYGDKSTRNFKVIDIKTLPEKDAAVYLFAKRDDIDRQLNLITCGGTFDRASQTFDHRVIVVSQRTGLPD